MIKSFLRICNIVADFLYHLMKLVDNVPQSWTGLVFKNERLYSGTIKRRRNQNVEDFTSMCRWYVDKSADE